MTIFDFVVLALIAASVVAGALRGLVRAAITGLALILGIIIAARGYAMSVPCYARWASLMRPT